MDLLEEGVAAGDEAAGGCHLILTICDCLMHALGGLLSVTH